MKLPTIYNRSEWAFMGGCYWIQTSNGCFHVLLLKMEVAG